MIKTLHLNRDRKKLELFLEKRQANITKVMPVAERICEEIRTGGDRSLLKYTKKFDRWHAGKASQLKVTKKEMNEASRKVDAAFLKSLKIAKANIESFHQRQKEGRKTWHQEKGGLIVGEKYVPLEKAGIYVPGGKACYPSTVLMNVIPARIAGVEKIIIATPPSPEGKINPYVLAAADTAGAHEIFKIGGAQAIAAMAFGTKTIPAVDKIAGPGNMYVAAAKLLIQQKTNVGIDMLAGPTEIVIIADEKANAGFVAADMLSQAEHGVDSVAVVITTSGKLARDVRREIDKRIKEPDHSRAVRSDIIAKCLAENGIIIIVETISAAIELANRIAPEHLELQAARPWECMEKVRNAGAVFLGDYTPPSLGDYMAGPNHVLPTAGRARFSSPLGVDDFLKKTNFIFADRMYLKQSQETIVRLAESEGFDAHAETVRIRTKN